MKKKEHKTTHERLAEGVESGQAVADLYAMLQEQAQTDQRLKACEDNDIEQDDRLELMSKTLTDQVLPLVDAFAGLKKIVYVGLAVGAAAILTYGGIELTKWVRKDAQNETVREITVENGQVISDTETSASSTSTAISNDPR